MQHPVTFYGDSWEMSPTRAQHDRMVAKAGHPVTMRPQRYAGLGHVPTDVQKPKGVRAHLRSSS